MRFTVETAGDIRVLVIQQNLDGGWETFAIKDRVTQLVREGARKLILDLEAVRFMNSTGIGVMVAILATVRGAGGHVKFASIGDRVRRSLVATGGGIWESLEVCPNLEAAISEFGAFHIDS